MAGIQHDPIDNCYYLHEFLDAVLVALDASGRIVAKAFEVPGALAPVMCDAEHGTATYVEPNVWVRHATDV